MGLSFNEAEYLTEMNMKATNTANVPPDTAINTAKA